MTVNPSLSSHLTFVFRDDDIENPRMQFIYYAIIQLWVVFDNVSSRILCRAHHNSHPVLPFFSLHSPSLCGQIWRYPVLVNGISVTFWLISYLREALSTDLIFIFVIVRRGYSEDPEPCYLFVFCYTNLMSFIEQRFELYKLVRQMFLIDLLQT